MIAISPSGTFYTLHCEECEKISPELTSREALNDWAKRNGWIKVWFKPPERTSVPVGKHYCNDPCKPEGLIAALGERVY